MKTDKKSRMGGHIAPVMTGLFAVLALAIQPGQAQTPNADGAAKIAAADNGFGLRLFQTIRAKEAGKNVCVSPTSVALALQMVYNGASGTTKTAMAKTLELNGMRLEDVNRANLAFLNSLAAPPAHGGAAGERAQLNIANSLWLRDERSVLPNFRQRAQKFYKAEVGSLQGAPQNINAWVSRHTQAKIPTIVSAQDVQNTSVALVNAVYFKGVWETPFRPERTAQRPFHLAEGGEKQCRMMTESGDFSYYQGDLFQMVSLPYRNSELEMVVILPKAGTTLAKLAGQITPQSWRQWTEKLASGEGTVELPRFRAEFGLDLKSALTTLGMGEAFGSAADFSAMSGDKSLMISRAIHKTYVNVNEQGTEAAAATAVLMAPKGARIVTAPFKITMDRPFLYAIRDQQTGALLFMGTVVRPE